MERSLPLLLLIIIFISCEKKTSTSSDAQVEKLCYKGKFVADACNGLAIVQVMEPAIDSLNESVFFSNGWT